MAGARVSEGVRKTFWLLGMQSSIIGSYDCIKAFSETDQTENLKKIDVPVLVIQGDADQIVPIDDSGKLSAKACQAWEPESNRRRPARAVYDPRRCHQSGTAHISGETADGCLKA